jgi:uncharacterized integral membrane protein
MYLRTLLIVFVLGALAVFTALNWTAFVTPTTLSLVFGTVEAPLGLILLGMLAALATLFLSYVVYLQSSVLFESRRFARELQAQRELAEQAELSRLTQLQAFLKTELGKLGDKEDEARAGILERVDRLDRELRAAVEQGGNSLAAYLGEIDDRLERAIAGQPARKDG